MLPENIIIASVIHTLSALIVLAYLHSQAKDQFFKALWLTMIFLILTYAFVVEQFGFNTDLTTGTTPLSNLSASALTIVQGLIAGFVLLSGLMFFELFMMIGRWLWDGIEKIQGVAE